MGVPTDPRIEIIESDTRTFAPWRPPLELPQQFLARVDDPGAPYLIEMDIVPRDGRPVATRLALVERSEPVTSEGLRSVRLAHYVEMASQEAAWERAEEAGTIVHRRAGIGLLDTRAPGATDALVRLGLGTRPPSGRRLTDEHLQEVLRVYEAAKARGSRAPRKEVVVYWREAHGEVVADQTVAGWLQKARKRQKAAPKRQRGRATGPRS